MKWAIAFFSRAPSTEYVLFTEVNKKGNTLYGMRTNENTIVIPAVYTSNQTFKVKSLITL